MKQFNNLTQKKLFVYIFYILIICALGFSYIYKINLSNLFGPFEFNTYLLKFNVQAKMVGLSVILNLTGCIFKY